MRRDMSRDGANVAQGLLGRFGCAGIAIGGFVMLAASLSGGSINVVPPGHVGVVIHLGQVQPNTLPPGVYFRPVPGSERDRLRDARADAQLQRH